MKRSLRLLAAGLVTAVVALLPAQAARASAPVRGSWPVTVTIQTVPALSGVHFSWDGVVATSDRKGRVRFTNLHNFAGHTLSVLDTNIATATRRYEFVRWAGQRDPDQAFRSTVTGLPMRANYTVTAAFSVQYPVTFSFVDQRGEPVEARRITHAVVKGDDGRLITVDPTGTTWLAGSVPTYRKSTLTAVTVGYSLQEVVVDSVNATDAGRQRFLPTANTDVSFAVGFHDLTVTARDFLLGPGAGKAAVITGPDGVAHTVAFASDGTARLAHVPRGVYTVDILGARGVVLSREVKLSRDQRVEITVVGWLDLAGFAVAGLLIAVGLLVVGRPGPRRYVLTHLRTIMIKATGRAKGRAVAS